MKIALLSIVTGLVVGLVFRLMKLPLPAPNVLAGVLGIVGIFLGGVMGDKLIDFFTKI